MKIAVTGSTWGIGAAIKQKFQEQGHQVIDFSRSEGWDISDPATQDRIVEEIQDCDVFVNNAHAGFSQVDLLFKAQESWRGKKKIIVNIGSSITMRWDTKNRDPRYRNEKLALDDACEFLWNRDPWPQIMLFKPCAADTPRMSHWSGEKVSPEEFAEFLYLCLNQKKFRVQQVGIAINPTDPE
jgi:hypothetical protein